MIIRPEKPSDIAGIYAVLTAAFPAQDEAKLVDALRAGGRLTISLVAEDAGAVVGHIAFSPVSVGDAANIGLGLAPMAVLPSRQRQGIGGQLIEAGLTAAKKLEIPFVVVLGHTEYYPRFGFRRGKDAKLDNEYGADAAFMVVELKPGGIPRDGGLVRYGREFAAWS